MSDQDEIEAIARTLRPKSRWPPTTPIGLCVLGAFAFVTLLLGPTIRLVVTPLHGTEAGQWAALGSFCLPLISVFALRRRVDSYRLALPILGFTLGLSLIGHNSLDELALRAADLAGLFAPQAPTPSPSVVYDSKRYELGIGLAIAVPSHWRFEAPPGLPLAQLTGALPDSNGSTNAVLQTSCMSKGQYLQAVQDTMFVYGPKNQRSITCSYWQDDHRACLLHFTELNSQFEDRWVWLAQGVGSDILLQLTFLFTKLDKRAASSARGILASAQPIPTMTPPICLKPIEWL